MQTQVQFDQGLQGMKNSLTNSYWWLVGKEKSRNFNLLILQTERFVCVEVLRPRQPNGVMSSAVSLPNHMFTGQA